VSAAVSYRLAHSAVVIDDSKLARMVMRGALLEAGFDVVAEGSTGPEAVELYGFVKTLDTYRSVIDADTTLILSTDSELFRLLKSSEGKKIVGK